MAEPFLFTYSRNSSEMSMAATEWVKPPEVQVYNPIVPDVIVQSPVLGENVTGEDTQKEPNITIKKGVDFYLILSCIWPISVASVG